MADAVRFHFDPICPWCWQTSRWARRLEEVGEISLTYGVFCLELNNFTKPHDAFDPERSRSAPSLRTAVLVRDEVGERACGAFYAALGERYFHAEQDITDPTVVEGALVDAGLDAGLLAKAVDDRSTWQRVRDEHEAVAAEVGAFGVPTIRLDGGTGPAIFGPVVSEPPGDDEEAVELWRHVSWLVRNPNFHELKRNRATGPDLPYWRTFLARRAAAAAAETPS